MVYKGWERRHGSTNSKFYLKLMNGQRKNLKSYKKIHFQKKITKNKDKMNINSSKY